MTITANDLPQILAAHGEWLRNEEGGRRAVLSGAVLRGANLSGANLSGADLRGANLSGADLSGADLRGADMSGADLRDAVLRDADLRDADLSGADMRRAVLSGAVLRGANLSDAVLRDANLSEANLSGAVLLPDYQIPQEGALIVWKAVKGGIAKIEVPAEAKRTSCLINRKCRAEFVRTIEIVVDGAHADTAPGRYDASVVYRVGEITRPDSYDDNPAVDCTHGIHFFLTRAEAEKW